MSRRSDAVSRRGQKGRPGDKDGRQPDKAVKRRNQLGQGGHGDAFRDQQSDYRAGGYGGDNKSVRRNVRQR